MATTCTTTAPFRASRYGRLRRGGRPRFVAVFFDFDGVLIDSDRLWWSVIDDVLESRSLPRSKESARRRGLRLEDVIGGLGIGDEQIVRSVAAEVRRIAEPSIADQPLMEGAVETICDLSAADVVLGVVSSSNSILLERVLRRNAVRNHFDVLVGGERVTKGKPAPDGYRLAAQEIKADPARCCAVEDSSDGMEAAEKAGMHIVHFTQEVGTADSSRAVRRGHAVVTTLHGLRDIVLGS
jgi:HAD superfamily hydrolase (TIGR01509 family)